MKEVQTSMNIFIHKEELEAIEIVAAQKDDNYKAEKM